MSIERCCKHDKSFDTDFVEQCPACAREDLEADVLIAERIIDKATEQTNDQG